MDTAVVVDEGAAGWEHRSEEHQDERDQPVHRVTSAPTTNV
jgi:hypothetical protein